MAGSFQSALQKPTNHKRNSVMDTPLLKAALHEAVLNENTRLKKELKEKAMELEAIKQQS